MKKSRVFGLGLAAVAAGVIVWGIQYYRNLQKNLEKYRQSAQKYALYFDMLTTWVGNKSKGLGTADVLKKHGMNKAVIYGAGNIGEALYAELKAGGIPVLYFIDNNGTKQLLGSEDGRPVVGTERVPDQEAADVYIITAYYYFDSILQDLKLKGIEEEKIVSLEDLVYEQ